MTLILELPEALRSPLGRMDPRWKLAALLLAALLLALLRTPWPSVVGLLGAWLLVLLAHVPLGWYAGRMTVVALFLGMFLIWLPFVPGNGFAWAVVLLLRGLSLVTLALVLVVSSPVQETFHAAHALHMPGLLVHVALLTYRYVFLLGEEFGRLRTALRVRGYRNRANLHSYRTIGQVTGTLLVRGHERAERVGQAMQCRGFDGFFRSLHEYETRLGDVLSFLAIVGSACGLLAWDGWLR